MSKKVEIVKWKNSWESLEQTLQEQIDNCKSKAKKEILMDVIKQMQEVKLKNSSYKTTSATAKSNKRTPKNKKQSVTISKTAEYMLDKFDTITTNLLDKLRI